MKNKPNIREVLLDSSGLAAVLTLVSGLVLDWFTKFSDKEILMTSFFVFLFFFISLSFASYYNKCNLLLQNSQEKETPPQSVSEDKPVQEKARRPC